ncbi:hypothetical protein [uncultured Roseivirga sp.]|uniref:hypothetical protein n=1 Tax=uncultured Roseivirga sp. TaxID=543088 RepID=UPI0030DBD3FB|tara:strand:+ start:330665 stop:331165 length:501 start_codon:yes stop_codon:yes gene_type:complete
MQKIKTILFSAIALLFMTIGACSRSTNDGMEVISGDLYFKLIEFDGFYGTPDSLINKFEYYIDSMASLENLNEDVEQFLKAHQLLKSNDLINLPNFSLKVDSVTNIQVYLDETEFESIKNFDRSQLIRDNNKVRIVLEGEYISDQIVRCSKILNVTKVEGKTYWRK